MRKENRKKEQNKRSTEINEQTNSVCLVEQQRPTLGGDPFSSTGGGRELVLVLAAGGSTL